MIFRHKFISKLVLYDAFEFGIQKAKENADSSVRLVTLCLVKLQLNYARHCPRRRVPRSPRGALPSLFRLFGTSKTAARSDTGGERRNTFKTPHPNPPPLVPTARAATDGRESRRRPATGSSTRSSPAPLHPWVVARLPPAAPPLRPLAKADRLLARFRFSPTFKMAAAASDHIGIPPS
jgi:hypothetical protein